jgi:acyl-CoA thioester hydrolase
VGDLRTEVPVRFHELDPNGHLNHSVYLNHFETARIEVLDRIGFGSTVLRDRGIHLVVVEANVRFRRPAVLGDVVTIDSEVAELRRASCWWHQRMTRSGELLAEIDVRSSAVGPDGRPTRPPEDLLVALEALRPEVSPV